MESKTVDDFFKRVVNPYYTQGLFAITSLNTANKNGNVCRNNPICLGRQNIYKYNIAGHIHCYEYINQPIINDKFCFFPLSDVLTTINPYAEELDDSAEVKPRFD